MPSVYQLKPAFQGLLRPIVRSLAANGVTANQVTLAAMVLSLATGIAIAREANAHRVLLLLPVVLFARMALNAMDGMLAREFNQKSALGAILNELGDLILARLNLDGYHEQSRTNIMAAREGAPIWAHPAYAGDRVYARSDSEIVCVRLTKGGE